MMRNNKANPATKNVKNSISSDPEQDLLKKRARRLGLLKRIKSEQRTIFGRTIIRAKYAKAMLAEFENMYEELKLFQGRIGLFSNTSIANVHFVDSEKTNNQGIPFDDKRLRSWNNLFFRSATEVKIAEACERANVLFLPNCMARLGGLGVGNRQNREADFLICHKGKWGILEVDGEGAHPTTRTAQDHERDRLFKVHGIVVIEHYDAPKCYNNPDEVVREFLMILGATSPQIIPEHRTITHD